jgi:predicted DNA-binding transcriptional regulator AlpA
MSDTRVANPPSQLLTAKAVGQILGLSRRRVFRLDSPGKILGPEFPLAVMPHRCKEHVSHSAHSCPKEPAHDD